MPSPGHNRVSRCSITDARPQTVTPWRFLDKVHGGFLNIALPTNPGVCSPQPREFIGTVGATALPGNAVSPWLEVASSMEAQEPTLSSAAQGTTRVSGTMR